MTIDGGALVPSPVPLTGARAVSGLGRLRALRDRWLASPAFQRWAASFPLTRGLAERRARALFDLCAGFVYSQVLQSCVRVNLFTVLAEGPQPAAVLAPRLGLSIEAAERLLRAAASLRLAERRGADRFGLGDLGAVLVGNGALVAMIEHHALVYRDLADPLALLRGEAGPTRLGEYWAYAGTERPRELPAGSVDDYTTLMSASQGLVCEDVLDAYAIGRHRRLLDVGGGDGTFALAAARRAPELTATVFDLPPVAERARQRSAASGLANRVDAVGGDFHRDALPPGADLVSFVRVLHDHDDSVVRRLLTAARAALPAGGRLLIAEPMSGTDGAEPVGDAYFAFYLLAMGHGRARTAGEYGEFARAAGFTRLRHVRTRRPLQTSLLLADVGP